MATKNVDGYPLDKLRAGCQLTNRDLNFIAICNELRVYVEEHKHFPVRHTSLHNQIHYDRKKINAGTLEDWKLKMLTEIAQMRDMTEPIGGRRKRVLPIDD